jgi:hypothetical protein
MAYKVQLPTQRIAEQYLSGSPIPEKVVTAATVATEGGIESLTVNRELGVAYRRYWTLSETEPLEVFRQAYLEITSLEVAADPENAWRTLREAATAYHVETGRCPFCGKAGPLHLPADQFSMELRDGK